MKDINAQLKNVRPKLRDAAPLTHKIVWSFVVFNYWIAITIYAQRASALQVLPIFSGLFNRFFWATIFVILATGLMWGVIFNSWTAIRRWMILAVFVKAMWFYALVAAGARTGYRGELGVIGLWLFAAWVQIVTVAYFIPGKARHGDWRSARFINR